MTDSIEAPYDGAWGDLMMSKPRAALVFCFTLVASTAAAQPAEEPEEEPKEKPVAGYDDGFFVQSPDGNYKLVIGGYTRFRFTYAGLDATDVIGDQEDAFFFSIPQARLVLAGNVFTPDFTYRIMVDFGQGDIPTLKDAYFDYAAVKNALHFQAGSFKVPFGRARLTGVTKLDLVDRPITDAAWDTGWDLGVMVHNKTKSFIEYAAGVFNGYGDSGAITGDVTGTADLVTGEVAGQIENVSITNIPVRLKPLVAGRFGYNYGEVDGYNQLDTDGGPPRFGIAANSKVQFNADHADEALADVGGDLIFKLYGVTIHGAVYARWAQNGPALSGPGDLSYDMLGVDGSASYLFDDLLFFAARYARILPDGADNDTQEILGGIGVFALDKHFKSQLDGGVILREDPTGDALVGGDRVDWRIRTQLQVQL